MKTRRSLVVISSVLLVLLVAVAALLYALPTIARHIAVARLQAITKRPVAIDRVEVRLLTGRLTIHGLRVAEPDGGAPFAELERLDARLHLPSLARGHIWVRELVIVKPTLRIVRLEKRFNFSDLFEGSETTRKRFDVTFERFGLVDGTVAFEDRALPEQRTWTSDSIQIEAHNVSTLSGDGSVVASSVTAGAPNLVRIEQFRLYPIHLQATVTVKGLDLALARLYLPPDAPVVLDRGRVSSTLNVTYDARDDVVRANLTGELEDLALVKPGQHDPVTRIPTLKAQLTELTVQNDQLRVGALELKGSADVRDPRARTGARYQVSAIRASIADLTWPITTPGRLDVATAIPGGGTLEVSGLLRPPPAASQLRLRVRDLDVAAWNRYLPVTARLSGLGEADLRINEPLAAGVPARVNGSIAVNRLGIRDSQQELIGARRVEATGLAVEWPTRVRVGRIIVSGPRAIVERDQHGNFPLTALLARAADAPSAPAKDAGSAAADIPRVDVGEFAVSKGVLSWRDETVEPRVAFDLSEIDASITGGGWPLRPLGVKLTVRPPGGGQIEVSGRVGVDPLGADLRVRAQETELAHYQPYVPSGAQFSGRADFNLAVVVPVLSEPRATVRGDAALSRVDVRDGQRTVMRVGRVAVSALDIDWPRKVSARELTLRRPWILLERDQSGAFPLRALLTPDRAAAHRGDTASTSSASRPDNGKGEATIPVVLGQLVVEEGGARLVDGSLTPAFAVDVADLATRIEAVSTAPGARPSRVEMKARVADGLVSFAGTIGPITGPLRLDLQGELREFAVPRTNPYLLNVMAWEARNGWLTTNIQCRIDGNDLQANADVVLSRLQLSRAGGHDEAQARVGLPLGMITSLMKDQHGDIHLALPIGGRVNDPRFDLKELIWSTVRKVALKAVTAPVSLVGRVTTGADSRIERIEIDPVHFVPGTSTPTPEGQEQLARLVAFLDQTQETRLAATVVVSRRDVAAFKRPDVDAVIGKTAREARISPEEAAARLFQERFPGRPIPESADAVRAALGENEVPPADAVSTLADKRLEAVRTTIKKAKIDAARLLEDKRPPEVSPDEAPQVRFELVESESSGRPGKKTELPRRLSDASPPSAR